MRLSFGPALGVGIASEAEYVDVEMMETIEASIFSQRLSEKLPPDLALVAAKSVISNASLAAELNLAAYRVSVVTRPTPENIVAANKAVAEFQQAESVTYVRRSPKGIKTMDLKTYVVGNVILAVGTDSFEVEFWLRMTSSGAVKPQEVIRALIDQFGFPAGELLFRRTALKAETSAGIKEAFEI
jgi:radical SAM-linked protein